MNEFKIINLNNNYDDVKPLSLEQLKEMDEESIFTKFDKNKDKFISDKEIHQQGYVSDLFNQVKEYLIRIFGCAVRNPIDSNGFVDYVHNERELQTIYNLSEIPLGSHFGIRDARNCDISNLNLSREELLNLCIDDTTILSEEQNSVLMEMKEKAKDPGLNIKKLHNKGYTGKGIKIAIIDQPLGHHKEYDSNISRITNINIEQIPIASNYGLASEHGAAVVSIAVGKSVGVAPEAQVEYYSALNLYWNSNDINNCAETNINHAKAINQILDENEKRKDEDKVSVISISWGFNRNAPGYEDITSAIDRAKKQGVLVVCTSMEDFYDFSLDGANRNLNGDINDSVSYETGACFKKDSNVPNNSLKVPMDHRTVADYRNNSSYRYEGNDGGLSWAAPWLTGMYALAKQANPNLTPDDFLYLAKEHSSQCFDNDTNEYVGQIINPEKLLEECLKK